MNFVLVIDALDGAAVDAALEHGETVALTVGDAEVESICGAAKARGCTRAIRVWDEALLGVDYLAIAQVLQRTVRMVSGDDLSRVRVFSGERGHAGVAPAVADRLGIASLAGVERIERQGDRLIATRADGEKYALLDAGLVAIVPNDKRALEPHASSGVERVTLGDVGLLADELLYRRRFALAPLTSKEGG